MIKMKLNMIQYYSIEIYYISQSHFLLLKNNYLKTLKNFSHFLLITSILLDMLQNYCESII